jgi:hypothetical protein
VKVEPSSFPQARLVGYRSGSLSLIETDIERFAL